MRNIIVADSAGFCFGVERAVKILNETVEKGVEPIYTYGPIIHNEHVVKEYEAKGVKLYPVKEEASEKAQNGESENVNAPHDEPKDVDAPHGEPKNVNAPHGEAKDVDAPNGKLKNGNLLPHDKPQNGSASQNGPENNDEAPGTIVLRSHGVSKATQDSLEKKGMKVVDATCPFVKKIHIIVEDYSKKGYGIVILGNKDHPEVLGTIGWIENGDYRVVENERDIENLDFPIDKKLCVVAQTTFRHDKFQIFVDLIRQKGYYIYALNTICSATEVRQDEARRIASKVDVMLVIGDRLSSNSRKLFEICKGQCKQTYFLETSDDLDLQTLQSIQNIGITAGASTPKNIIEEVFEKCQK